MFKLPELPYVFDALEPYIDARTMEIHYTGHHAAYVKNLNDTLKDYPELQDKSLTDLLCDLNALPEKIRTSVRNNAGGDYNHTFFWPLMTKNAVLGPLEKSAQGINKTFGSFEQFQKQFNDAAKSRFGSGWAWLVVNKQSNLEVTSTANQDCPISQGQEPILGLDVWEHAYYLKYQNKRVDYIQAWWHVVNWQQVEDNFRKVC
ncbi:MAG: superoxide dismutase [Candidatus Babeliaceae bacterium]|nr:superoxide dismutase [Candidatus Babeliaceae bacterium]